MRGKHHSLLDFLLGEGNDIVRFRHLEPDSEHSRKCLIDVLCTVAQSVCVHADDLIAEVSIAQAIEIETRNG